MYGYLLGVTRFGEGPNVYGIEDELAPGFADIDSLSSLFRTAEESFNASLGFHDNYADYLPSEPNYDPGLRRIGHPTGYRCQDTLWKAPTASRSTWTTTPKRLV